MAITKEQISVIEPVVQKMYDGLKGQGFKRSMIYSSDHERDICVYRGPNGLKCAIGHIIPDELYDNTLENFGIESYRVFGKTEFRDLYKSSEDFYEQCGSRRDSIITFLNKLQNVHDTSKNPDVMKERFLDECKKFNITIQE